MAIQAPPTPRKEKGSIQSIEIAGRELGATYQNTQSACTTNKQTAKLPSQLCARFTCRNNKSKNGTVNAKRASTQLTTNHPPRIRCRYQTISCGRFPA